MNTIMPRISPILMAMSLAAAGGTLAAAQDAAPTPPKVLQITREWVKPGKAGAVHDKSEAAFVSASTRAKLQGHYIALNSISGKSRALYMFRFPSFAAMEEDQKIVDKNAALTAEFDRAVVADGELLEGTDTAVFTYNEEMSYHPHPDLSHARYYELSSFHIRPGHRKEFSDCVKMVKEGNQKAGTSAHWGAYDIAYGGEDGTVIALTHRESLSEIDKGFEEGRKFAEAMGGEDGMRKLDEVCGQGIESSHTELFAINPKQSYAEEGWIKADPDFWKPKAKAPEPTAAKPAPAAPATKPASR
jgi:hypothetical protein